jgi:hydroxyacylglutathione hydrolase
MLYDTTADVIRKALRGLDLAPSTAAKRAGLAERDVVAASRGPVSAEILRQLAAALELNAQALAALPDYVPPRVEILEITRLELPFHDETVNAWLLESGGSHVLFDAGDGPQDVRQALDRVQVAQVDVFITHEHGDHIGGLRGLRELIRSVAGPAERERLRPGDRVQRGSVSIHVIDLPGHCDGALGYVVEGLAKPVCVTGDALFAGSIGGCAPGEPYRQALASIRDHILTLPGDTVLLPGHGPASTVASELQANPFLAAV